MTRRTPETLVLAMDIGTSSLRTALFDEKAERVASTSATATYKVRYRPDGSAELVPAELKRAAQNCVAETLRAYRHDRALARVPIAAVSASAFWHSLLGLDGNGKPLTPIYTWADARCANDAAKLREEFAEAAIHARTGCMLRSSFWPAKLKWLQRTDRKLFRSVQRWASPAEWIFEQLWGIVNCSPSMASGTGVFDSAKLTWDAELVGTLRLSAKRLPGIGDRSSPQKTMPPELASALFLTPIGDGAASNLGSGATAPRHVAVNIGTSAAVRVIQPRATGNSNEPGTPLGLFRYLVDDTRSLVGGAVSNAGNLRAWCLRTLNLPDEAKALERALSRSSDAADALTILPFWVSERAPTWPEELQGAIIGVTQATAPLDLLRATTTAVYHRLAQILELIETTAGKTETVVVSGGVLHSRAALQLLADCFGRDLQTCREPEASLRGAAVYALEKLGREVPPLRAGTRVRPRPAGMERQLAQRIRQTKLEALFVSDPNLLKRF